MPVRTLGVAAGAVAVVVACAGCSASPSRPAGPASALTPAASPLDLASAPGCSTATAAAPSLRTVRTAMVAVRGNPFAVAVTGDGRWAFVSLDTSVAVLRASGSFAPRVVRDVAVPGEAWGEALTPDGRYLLVASGSGATVINVARAERGSARAVAGTLSSRGGGAIEVALSPDGRFAFVTLEGSADAAVFNLARALGHGFGASDFVGDIPLHQAPVGMAVSPGGRWLYATSEFAPGGTGEGTLTVISLGRAEADPARSVITTVTAGCSPVRVITSADGRQVWVTARESDALLCFSASALLHDPARSLTAWVRVGAAPVGLVLVDRGQRIVVADSNRFGATGAAASLGVVSVPAVLAGQPALVGLVRAGQFPRQFALEPGARTLLVTNYDSRQLEAVDVAGLP